ncbi:hypothetical protein ABG067_004088 [Albugo candida]
MSLGVQLHRTNIPINLLSHCNPVILSAYASYCLPDFFNISYRDLTWFDCLCIVLGTSAHPHESVKIKQDGTQRASTKLNGDIGMDRPIVRSNLNDLYDPRLDAVGSEMTVEDVADWISYSVQLPQYAEFAKTHSISGGTLSLLIENNGARLSSIGIRDEIHRVQLLRFLKLRYAGLGERPHDVSNFTCTISPSTRCSSEADEESCAYRRVHTSWIAPAQNVSQTFQLQRRDVKGSWTLVFAGSDSEYVDFIDTRNEPLLYQITTWNAYGRSSRVYTHCRPALIKTPANLDTNAAESNSDGTFFDYTFPFMQSCQKWKSEISTCKMKWSLLCSLYQYKGSHCWLDETIIFIILSIFLIRSYIYGDADFLLRLLRRLPPNISTQVVVKTFTDKVENVQTAQEALVDASAIVLWKKPLDNGIPIVFYRICWTRMKTRETMCVRIVRCFPHCCPAHRTRSYCGAPLFVEFTCYENARTNADDKKVAEDEFARFDKLIVYGRFEEHDNDDDNVGFVQHQEAQQLVQVSLTSGGSSIATDQCIWFRGELVMSRPNYRLFALNNRAVCHWEYDWKSGNRQRIRGTDHHFRAYVFTRTDDDNCTVITSVTSTPFTFSSYRKIHDPEQYESEVELLHQQRLWEGSDSTEISEHNADTSIQLVHRSSSEILQESSQQLSLGLLAASNSFCVQQSANFAILHLFMSVAKIPWSSILFKDERFLWQLLLRKCKGSIEHKRSHADRYISLWIKLLSPNELMDATHSIRLHPVSLEEYEVLPYQQQVYALALTCWELFCYLLAPDQWETIHAFLWSNPGCLSYEFYTCRMHATFIELLAAFCSQALQERRSFFCIIDVLANELVSIVLRDSQHRIFSPFAAKEIHSLLRNGNILGIAHFTSQMQHIFSSLHLQLQHSNELGTQRNCCWVVGNWIWQDCHIADEYDSQNRTQSKLTHYLGFLDIILMIQHMYGFEIRYEPNGEEITLYVRSVTSLFHDIWSSLILDGKLRTLKVFPDGITTSIYSSGKSVLYGDYVGKGTGDLSALGSGIELLLYIYRWGEPSIQLKLQLTPIPADAQSHDALADRLLISVVVNHSSSHIEMQKNLFEQLDPEQRRKSITRWDAIYALRLDYKHSD